MTDNPVTRTLIVAYALFVAGNVIVMLAALHTI